MRKGLALVLGALGVLAALTGCDVSGRHVGFFAQIQLPDGTPANLYAAYQDLSRTTTQPTFPNQGAADAMFYIGSDQCQSIYYQGDITIAQDLSTAVLNLHLTKWGDLTVNLTATGTPMPSAPMPIVCPDTNPNDINISDPNHITTGVQQYVVGAGDTATGTYAWTVHHKSAPTEHINGAITTADIGTYVYDSVFNNDPVVHLGNFRLEHLHI